MNNNNSRLIIIPYYLDELSIDSIRNSTCDILALSLPVIQQLDSEKIIYFTLGNFINQKDFDTHLSKLTKSLTDFLKINDSLSKDQFSLERLFSSNGFWFLHRLSHLSFLQMLIDSLENKYDQIEIYLRKNNHSKKDISINFHSLNFPINNLCGLDGIVESLNIGLKNKIVNKINILETTKNLNSLNQPVMQLLKRLPEITLRKIKEKFEKLVCSLSLRKKLFWTTFISYDVDRLKNKKYSWNFKPIMKTQSLLANDCVAEDTTELRERIYPLSNDFIMKWIPSFSNKFQAIIDGYVENIISRIPNVRLSIQKEIEKHNPKAIFFSTGIQNILQANIAQIAYKKKIPVY